MKVLVYSARPFEREVLSRTLGTSHNLTFTDQKLSVNTAKLAEGYEAISIFTSDDASGRVLEILSEQGVRGIALRSVGFDHVDLVRAGALDLRIANVPEYSPYSVAEHAVALLMTGNRKLLQARFLHEMNDYRLDTLVGFDVHGKTVGVIGTGNIGMAFVRIMIGFGARVIASDPVQNPAAVALGVHYVSLSELLKSADIVSVHCPLNEGTRHLLGEKEFALMKDNAVLLNTSRGAIIDTKALIKAIEAGKFRLVGLDVYEKEKGIFFEDHRRTNLTDEDLICLQAFQNVLITGHQGFLTEEALEGIANTTLLNLNAWQNDQRSLNELQKSLSQSNAMIA